MAKYSTDRRSLLKIIGAVGATCTYPFASEDLYGQTADQHHHTPPEQQAQPRFFNNADFQTISRIADLIIPETDTPGAIRAGVPAYIDLIVARNTDQQLVVADGLRWLDAESRRVADKTFLALTEEQQLAILQPLCDASDSGTPRAGRNVQFFSLLKNLTADGYYTSKIGLLDELRYKGDTVLSSYPSCDASK
jgi:gluconate 2-dehydrogenase gamma chain